MRKKQGVSIRNRMQSGTRIFGSRGAANGAMQRLKVTPEGILFEWSDARKVAGLVSRFIRK